MPDELAQLTGFVYEIGLLKRYKRTGWLVAGVSDPRASRITRSAPPPSPGSSRRWKGPTPSGRCS